MFERFDEKARRVVFWARAAAGLGDESSIRPLHLLAGIRKEMPKLLKKVGLVGLGRVPTRLSEAELLNPANASKFSTEIPLSEESKKALELADKASRKFGSETTGPVHVLWGVFHADAKLRKALSKKGLTGKAVEALCRQFPAFEAPRETSGVIRPIVSCTPVSAATSSRSGIGYDLHRLAEGRKLILGGVAVPFEKGPVGHSDGDVLSHAICDALLGAAGLGDIGTHFPDTDPKWKGASSLVFLETVRPMLSERSLRIAHIDAVIIAEKPQLGPHFPAMRAALAKALGVRAEQINLKAKTNEGVDAIGRGEAIAAQAIATLEG